MVAGRGRTDKGDVMNGANRVAGWLAFLIVITGGALAGASPNQSARTTWDLQMSVPAYLAANVGAEFDGRYFYTCKLTTGTIFVYDQFGSYEWTTSIPGVGSLWDLAYDGRYLYGGSAGPEIFVMDLVDEVLVATIASPVPVRHIAYDQDNDAFWVGDDEGDIVLVDRDGVTLATISQANHGLHGIHGSACDNWSDGGPFLWLFDQGAGVGSPQLIHQISLTTLAPTGQVHDAAADLTVGNDLAGGLFLTPSVVAGTVSLGGLMQGDRETFFCYELTAWTPPESYLLANFDDQPSDVPIGTGGPARGEPVWVAPSVVATVRSGPMPTPSLEIQDNSSVTAGSALFRFHEGFEVAQGVLEIRADLWFPELNPGHDFYVYVRERESAAQSFLNLEIRSSGDVWCYDYDSYNGVIGSVDAGRVIPLRMRFDLDAGTYAVWIDGELGIADEPHGITGDGVGSVYFGCDYDADLVGKFYVDNIAVVNVEPASGVEDESPGTPPPLELTVLAHPNPFNPRTTIWFDLETARHVKLSVYDLVGRRVKLLANEYFGAGRQAVSWNGTDAAGHPVSAGTYLARLEASGVMGSQKMVLVR